MTGRVTKTSRSGERTPETSGRRRSRRAAPLQRGQYAPSPLSSVPAVRLRSVFGLVHDPPGVGRSHGQRVRWLSPRPSKDRDSELSWTIGKLATCRQPAGKRACVVGRDARGENPGELPSTDKDVRGSLPRDTRCSSSRPPSGRPALPQRLAEAAELSESTVERIERGVRRTRRSTLERIARVLDADAPRARGLGGTRPRSRVSLRRACRSSASSPLAEEALIAGRQGHAARRITDPVLGSVTWEVPAAGVGFWPFGLDS